MVPWPMRVCFLNGILIESAIFVWLTVVTSTWMDNATLSVAVAHICAVHAV